MENTRYVLDSFAMLCFFEDEPGADHVQELLNSANNDSCELFMSVVNLCEVYYSIKRRKGQEASTQMLSLVDSFPINIENLDRSLAIQAGDIKSNAAIALADCFCAALAQKHSAAVVTGDPEFEKIEQEIQIDWLPRKPKTSKKYSRDS